MNIQTTTKPLKVLDFDIENRPLSYWYDGQPTAEVTSIACSWVGMPEVFVVCLGEVELPNMLEWFHRYYAAADMVTGHYIRKHDLPILNRAMMEFRLPPLGPKLTHDTKLDLIKGTGLSMSQEALSAMFRLENPKHHMTQADWRDANRLNPEGVLKTKKRVVDDVVQHKELYQELRDLGYLHKPKEWRP